MPFGPDQPSWLHRNFPWIVCLTSIILQAGMLLVDAPVVSWAICAFTIGILTGALVGWKAGWAAWERPFARMTIDMTTTALARGDELDDDMRETLVELHSFANQRLKVLRRW